MYGHCDKLVESTNRAGLMIDQIYNGLMIVYAIVSSIYLYQRSLHHSHTDLFDVITTNVIDSVSAVLFVKSIVYKSYLGQPGANSSALLKFIPCLKKLPHFTCHPTTALKGSQLTWYYADKAVLHPTLVSAACEFFPVLLIVHHFVAGKAHKIAGKLVKKDMLYIWSRKISSQHTDAEQVAESKADMTIIYWCLVAVTLQLIVIVVFGCIDMRTSFWSGLRRIAYLVLNQVF
uniref:Uncharacterized protein n=1 Tax=Ditylenchus dipsaci TaxID=166011 RepID=A0A915E516_9BILA